VCVWESIGALLRREPRCVSVLWGMGGCGNGAEGCGGAVIRGAPRAWAGERGGGEGLAGEKACGALANGGGKLWARTERGGGGVGRGGGV
jgi:hypothetical protein